MVKMFSSKSFLFLVFCLGCLFLTSLSQDDDADAGDEDAGEDAGEDADADANGDDDDSNAPDAPIPGPPPDDDSTTTVATTDVTTSSDGTTADGTATTGTGTDDSANSTDVTSTPTTPPPGDCVKNTTLIAQEKRDCRSSCSATKKCRNVKAECLCDGACGKVCIPPELKCKRPVDIEFGKVSVLEGTHFDAAATYHCDEGYELVGPDERTCQGDLKWSGKEPFCTPEGSRCKPPMEIDNATLVVAEEKTEYYVGDYAVYKCDEGFTPDGETSGIECVNPKPKVAEWTPVNFTCQPNPCEELEPIQNGTISGENFTFGENATYECIPGYTMVGEPTRECQADGTWTGRAPTCELPDVFCPIPKDPENGVVDFVPELYGHRVYYKCDPGYKINGTEFRQCISDGEWSDNDTLCNEIDCGMPEEPVNGSITFLSGTTWSKQVSYTCNDDTTAFGEEEITCLDNETWSAPPPVCLSHCIVTVIDHGFFVPAAVMDYSSYNMIPTGALLPHETKAQIACEEHYEMPSTEPIMQNHGDIACTNGTWAPTNECVPARCFCDDLKYDKLHERNFTLARDCVEPTPHDQEVLLKCDPEFPEMVEKGVLKCTIGEWVYPTAPNERCTKKSCSVQEIKLDKGKILKDQQDWVVPMDTTVVDHGTELRFECVEPGYELYEGKNAVNPPDSNLNFTIRECENGVWSGRMPVCKPARCLCSNLTSNLTERGVETEECQDLASSGDLIQLKCLSNYSNPTGPLIAECLLGEWKPIDTECKKMCSCDDLKSTLDKSLQASECAGFVGSNATINLECVQGYVNMTGSPEVTCNEGEWSVNDTFCNATEEVPVEELMRECIYKSESNQVQAFYQGSFLVNKSPVPHLGNISLRCSNGQNQKFIGKHQLQCIDGKFNDVMPECTGLIPDSHNSAPPLWLTSYPPDYIKVNEEGVFVIPRESAISITCWWSQGEPDITIVSDVKPKLQEHKNFNKISGWTTAFNTISETTTIEYSCGVPGSEKGGRLTQMLQIKISDTCRLPEKRIQSFGLFIDPESRKYLYSEGDRVDLICGPLIKKGLRFGTCSRHGNWIWGPEEDCPEDTTQEPTTEASSS